MCEDNQPDYRDDDNNHHRNEYSDSVEVSDNKNDTVVEFPILFDDYDVIERHENISYIDNGEVINDDNNTTKNQSMNIINRKSYDGDGDYLEMFSIPNYVYSWKSNTVDDDDDKDNVDAEENNNAEDEDEFVDKNLRLGLQVTFLLRYHHDFCYSYHYHQHLDRHHLHYHNHRDHDNHHNDIHHHHHYYHDYHP